MGKQLSIQERGALCADCPFRRGDKCGVDRHPITWHVDNDECGEGFFHDDISLQQIIEISKTRYVATDEEIAHIQKKRAADLKKNRHPERRRQPVPVMKAWGPPLWRKLHLWALSADLTTDQGVQAARQWIGRFPRPLPCGDCKRGWKQWVAQNPPDFSSNGNLFAWSVAAHNYVNQKMGRPSLTVAQALAEWNPRPIAADLTLLDRALVISLKRSPQRLEKFWANWPLDWPLAKPDVFWGVDGSTQKAKPGWFDGLNAGEFCKAGAWGCYQSWLAILDTALAADWKNPVLVMEDDCQLKPNAASEIQRLMPLLPSDWDLFYLGCQPFAPLRQIAPGLCRTMGAERTHAMIVHPRFFRAFADGLRGFNRHIDHWLREVAPRFNFFAAVPPLAGQRADRSLITNTDEAYRDWHAKPGVKSQTISHGGDVGDLIYAMPGIRAVSRAVGKPIDLVLNAVHYVRRSFTEQIVGELAPLLLSQPYIASVRFSEIAQGFDLNSWRRGNYPALYNLADRQLDCLGYPHRERDTPWLDVEPVTMAPVVIHRSPRYHSDRFPWGKVISSYRGQIIFVGLENEHEDFSRRFGPVPFCRATTWLRTAQIIAGAKLFIGNQSSPYAMAEALKKNTVLERCHPDNCHFERSNAIFGWDEKVTLPPVSAA